MPAPLALLICLAILAPPFQQEAEKQVIITIAGPELRGGIISEVTWDGGLLLLQGVFAQLPGGELQAQYFVIPAEKVTLLKRDEQTDESLKYWRMKASRISPTGLGRISSNSDTKMPQFGVGSLQRRLGDAIEMGGTQTKSSLRLGALTLLERDGPEPYDGETWSWSPAELNRIAYVDGKGDLWVARADGQDARRLLKGDFTLPAWSPDGRLIAIAERKDAGRRWEISIVHLPAAYTR